MLPLWIARLDRQQLIESHVETCSIQPLLLNPVVQMWCKALWAGTTESGVPSESHSLLLILFANRMSYAVLWSY